MTVTGTLEMNDCIYRNRAAPPVLLDKPIHTTVRSLVAALLLWGLGIFALHAPLCRCNVRCQLQALPPLSYLTLTSSWSPRAAETPWHAPQRLEANSFCMALRGQSSP